MVANADIHQHKILILDFGSQYTQLIARCVREIGVYCEIYPASSSAALVLNFGANGIILSGGPDVVHVDNVLLAPEVVFNLDVPVLGICYGMHLMAHQLGGKTSSADKHEYGFAKLTIRGNSPLLDGITDEVSGGDNLLNVWMSHGVEVEILPVGFNIIASTDNCQIAAFGDYKRNFYGLQFHPEVTHTTQGKAILKRFVIDICACYNNWTADNIIKTLTKDLTNQLGKHKVLLGLSGGVDSSVVAALLYNAIGDRLVCVFVDNGLLRLGEADEVMQTFADNVGIKVIRVDAKTEFYQALKGITHPEQKRKIIGNTFIKIFSKYAKELDDISYLAQGTIYPDVIESSGNNAQAKVIKSHHNVGGLPKEMHLKLVEPLRELFKDEVRKIGVKLGLSEQIIYRHPFPGPGLGVRILGEVKAEFADILRQADDIFISELRKHNLYDKVSQAFAVFLPVKSVGVTGDKRRYEFIIVLRAVVTIDFMTATWAELPYSFLSLVSNRIINEVPQVSRVVYDISGKPPATIEWE